jgi:hypothetical protein
MKFTVSIFATCIVSLVSSWSIDLADTNLPADSEIGIKLISKARRVEQNDAYGTTWLSGYSIKFLGCHHVQQVRKKEIMNRRASKNLIPQTDLLNSLVDLYLH